MVLRDVVGVLRPVTVVSFKTMRINSFLSWSVATTFLCIVSIPMHEAAVIQGLDATVHVHVMGSIGVGFEAVVSVANPDSGRELHLILEYFRTDGRGSGDASVSPVNQPPLRVEATLPTDDTETTFTLLRVRPLVEYTVRAWVWQSTAGAAEKPVLQGEVMLKSGSSGHSHFDTAPLALVRGTPTYELLVLDGMFGFHRGDNQKGVAGMPNSSSLVAIDRDGHLVWRLPPDVCDGVFDRLPGEVRYESDGLSDLDSTHRSHSQVPIDCLATRGRGWRHRVCWTDAHEPTLRLDDAPTKHVGYNLKRMEDGPLLRRARHTCARSRHRPISRAGQRARPSPESGSHTSVYGSTIPIAGRKPGR